MDFALIFDVDGVLADTEVYNARASVRMFRELYGVEVQPEDFRPFIGTGDERYVEGVAEKYGVPMDTPRAVQRRAELILELIASAPLPAPPGVLELVGAARAAGVPLAIATSGDRAKQSRIIEGTGLRLEWFDVVVTGDDVRHKKPDPEIYLLTIARLGLPAGRCIVFEDAPAGVQSAKAAGARCVAVTSSVGPEALAGADRIVASLTEVRLEELGRLLA